MFSHATIGTNDISRARDFYDAVMKTIGHGRHFDYEDVTTGYGKAGEDIVWICRPENGKEASVGNGMMIGFLAQDRKSVDDFHAAALDNGGSDEGAPGLRPHYHEHYYGAYVRDPDGNKLCVVCHKPA